MKDPKVGVISLERESLRADRIDLIYVEYLEKAKLQRQQKGEWSPGAGAKRDRDEH